MSLKSKHIKSREPVSSRRTIKFFSLSWLLLAFGGCNGSRNEPSGNNTLLTKTSSDYTLEENNKDTTSKNNTSGMFNDSGAGNDNGTLMGSVSQPGQSDTITIIETTDYTSRAIESFEEIVEISFAATNKKGTFSNDQLTGRLLKITETVEGTSELIINATGIGFDFSCIS